MEEVFSIYRGRDGLALKLSYQLFSKAKRGDKPVQISWNGFGVDPHLKFGKKVEDDTEFVLSSAPISYFGYNFLLKISINSKLVFFKRKFNSLQLFQKQRKPNFKVFQAKNAIQVATKKSNFFLAFFSFLKFFIKCIFFSIQIVFQKPFFEAKGGEKPRR